MRILFWLISLLLVASVVAVSYDWRIRTTIERRQNRDPNIFCTPRNRWTCERTRGTFPVILPWWTTLKGWSNARRRRERSWKILRTTNLKITAFVSNPAPSKLICISVQSQWHDTPKIRLDRFLNECKMMMVLVIRVVCDTLGRTLSNGQYPTVCIVLKTVMKSSWDNNNFPISDRRLILTIDHHFLYAFVWTPLVHLKQPVFLTNAAWPTIIGTYTN